MTLEKKLNKAKAQLTKKTTKADKLKVRQLERKFFLAKGMSGNSRKRKAPAERDNFQPAAKKPKDLCKRPGGGGGLPYESDRDARRLA